MASRLNLIMRGERGGQSKRREELSKREEDKGRTREHVVKGCP